MSLRCNHRKLQKLIDPPTKFKNLKYENRKIFYDKEIKYTHRCNNCRMYFDEERAQGMLSISKYKLTTKHWEVK